MVTGWAMRGRNRLLGLDRYDDARTYFGAGGLAEAEAVCAHANRDLLAFVRPPDSLRLPVVARRPLKQRDDGTRVEAWSFDSPLQSGDCSNDTVRLRLFEPPGAPERQGIVLFHHPVYQRHWGLWAWFLAALIERIPVAILAGPYHFERRGPGRFAGEGTINPNPARLFESVRQWCWDHEAAVAALRREAGRPVVAEIGYSLGAFQLLLLAAAGCVRVPIVSISCTNRYAWGLTRGVLGTQLLRHMAEAGIDREKLYALTESIQLEHHVAPLRGRPLLYIRGASDYVDPPPSLERLERELRPTRTVVMPGGHASAVLLRSRVMREIHRFLEDHDVLTPSADEPASRWRRMLPSLPRAASGRRSR